SCFNTYLTNGRINNVLLSQTITLSLNVRLNKGQLAQFPVQKGWLTTQLKGTCSKYGTEVSCNTNPNAIKSYKLNYNVVNYLTNNGSKTATVQDLLKLANDVLGGAKKPGVNGVPSFNDINEAVDAINNAFDGCRKFLGYYSTQQTCQNCQSSPITLTKGTLSDPVTDKIASSITKGETVIEESVSKISVTAYPNPFRDKVSFVILSPVSGKGNLDVYNALGQKIASVFEGQVVSGIKQTVEYKVPGLHKTTLIYVLKINDQQVTGKLFNIK
ncbi:MAG TPA: hypothetical protein VJU78_20895, partial [Chitinophagaceae bacterium]|nr:hypothetical protein [Chitinophagaceae bacterium]